jgi:hypothetical protein
MALGLRARIVGDPASTIIGCHARVSSISMQIPGGIQVKMPASTGRCGHLAPDDGVAVQ